MTVVAGFLVPGTPLPLLRPDAPHWGALAAAMSAAGERLAAHEPDVLLVFSSQWIAVLDELWQAHPRFRGVHVDHTWHELGDLPHDLAIDAELAHACVRATNALGVRAKAVDFPDFPVDSGVIAMDTLLNARARAPLAVAANNMYHDRETTERIAAAAAAEAAAQGKRAVAVGIGGLSGTLLRGRVDPAEDRVARPEDDALNRALLDALAAGDVDATRVLLARLDREAAGDQHLKHVSWLIGATGGFTRATVDAYAPTYGAGAAVAELVPAPVTAREEPAVAPGVPGPRRPPRTWRAAAPVTGTARRGSAWRGVG